MPRISWTKKITNEKVLELAGNKRSLMETIRKKQLSFVGHIIRENGLERLCLEGKIEGRKARGRQRLTYLVRTSKVREVDVIVQLHLLIAFQLVCVISWLMRGSSITQKMLKIFMWSLFCRFWKYITIFAIVLFHLVWYWRLRCDNPRGRPKTRSFRSDSLAINWFSVLAAVVKDLTKMSICFWHFPFQNTLWIPQRVSTRGVCRGVAWSNCSFHATTLTLWSVTQSSSCVNDFLIRRDIFETIFWQIYKSVRFPKHMHARTMTELGCFAVATVEPMVLIVHKDKSCFQCSTYEATPLVQSLILVIYKMRCVFEDGNTHEVFISV